jgi:hypothetical protein
MNLLSILLAVMTSKAALGQVSGKTGLSQKQIKKLMMIAIPILLKYMTQNASSGDGAQSLLGALMQHNKKEEVCLQLKDAVRLPTDDPRRRDVVDREAGNADPVHPQKSHCGGGFLSHDEQVDRGMDRVNDCPEKKQAEKQQRQARGEQFSPVRSVGDCLDGEQDDAGDSNQKEQDTVSGLHRPAPPFLLPLRSASSGKNSAEIRPATVS